MRFPEMSILVAGKSGTAMPQQGLD